MKPDGTVLLRIEPEFTSLSDTQVDLGNGTFAKAVDTEAIETTLTIGDGKTTAILTGFRQNPNTRNRLVLFVTPKVIHTDAELRMAQTAFASQLASAPTSVLPTPQMVAPPVWTPRCNAR